MTAKTTPWSEERYADAGAVRLCYQELGDLDGEPMLMVMGLGTQMIHWDTGFCELLAAEGYRVIRFDNRDVGRSGRIRGKPPSRLAMLTGLPHSLAYTLEDMADDALGLADALGLESAHYVGASMGGMIAQVAGYRSPDRVRSLGLLMTGSGKRLASLPRLRALGTLLREAPKDREGYADHIARVFGAIGSPDLGRESDRIRRHAFAAYDRGISRGGVARQLHAITASGDRSRKLRTVRAPTVVIHGAADPLVRPIAGRSVAEAIPGARMVIVPGMGHDLPPEVWPQIAAELVDNARRTESVEDRDAVAV